MEKITINLSLILGLFMVAYVYNKKLRKKLTEKDKMLLSKEQLLKEIHHRVTNNLQSIICLLESQARYLKDDAMIAVQSSANRVYAMFLIHKKLFISKEDKMVNIPLYIDELIDHISKSLGTQEKISFHMELAPMRLPIVKALPLALIINEAVTNAIKHAFPGNRKGCVEVKTWNNDGILAILVRDNGIGFDSRSARSSSASLGLKLMNGLCDDLDGKISIENQYGTCVTLRVHLPQLNADNAGMSRKSKAPPSLHAVKTHIIR